MNRIEKVGVFLFGAAILAVLTVAHSYYVCSDCSVIRESYDVCGIPIFQWKTPTRLTELLYRYRENPPHSHRYVMAGRTSFFRTADGIGAVITSYNRQYDVMDFLERMYQFEDRQEARRWREKLLRPDDSIHRFQETMGENTSRDIPKGEAEWRSWWAARRLKFESAVFSKAATAP